MHLNSHIADLRLRRIRVRARGNNELPPLESEPAYPVAERMAAAEPNPGSPDRPEGERRRSDRVSLDTDVLVRRIGGFNFDVGIQDISTGGCRIDAIEEYEVGDPVITRFPQLEPLGSRVCWTEGTTVGIQFLRNIHPAVLDSLVERLA